MSSKQNLFHVTFRHERTNSMQRVYLGMRNHGSSAVFSSGQSKRYDERKADKLDDLHSLTGAIVDATIQRDRVASWYYPRIKGGQEKRLKRDLQLFEAPNRIPSREYNDFFLDTSESLPFEHQDTLWSEISVEPGTFVELRRNLAIAHAVVVGHSVHSGIPCILSLNTTGEIWRHRQIDIMFAIPGFCDKELMSRCGAEEISKNTATSAARIQVLKKAREFERATEAAFLNLRSRIEGLYPEVKSRNPNEWSKISTLQAARIIDKRPNIPILDLFAVHKHLMTRAEEFVIRPGTLLQFRDFDVRPQSHMDNIKLVVGWVRTKDVALNYFSEKASAIIDISRILAHESSGELPSRAEVTTPSFNVEDKAILFYLEQYVQPTHPIYRSPYATFAPFIMKMISRYHDKLIDTGLVQKFLAEIGVRTPWQDVASQSRIFDVYVDSMSNLQDHHGGRSENILENPSFQNEHSVDQMQSIRHDFGDMPVYVIDDEGAQELDDGISYEEISSDLSSAWVHVHIADPTAFMTPKDVIARQARRKMETAYLILKTFPMLPENFLQRGVSLGTLSQAKKAQNVVTFSCKIDTSGQITDYKVRAGLVKNVVILKYDQVNALLGEDDQGARTEPFNPLDSSFPVMKQDVSHLLQHRHFLRALFEISQRSVKSRLTLPIFSWSQSQALVSVYPKKLPEIPAGIDAPELYRGYPQLTYSVINHRNWEIGARSMVAEFMKAACRVASRFCNEYDIPAIRRSVGKINAKEEDIQDLLAKRDEFSYVDAIEVWKAGVRIGEGKYTLEPAGHWSLGIPEGEGYVRVTSPLRRYQDMVMHWQIKHALLKTSSRNNCPFTKDNLLQLISDMKTYDNNVKSAVNSQERYWPRLYIARVLDGLEGKQTSGLDVLHCIDAYTISLTNYNSHLGRFETDIHMPSLGVSANLINDQFVHWPVGHLIKVRINHVQLGTRPSILAELVQGSD